MRSMNAASERDGGSVTGGSFCGAAGERTPIWLAALFASRCLAVSNGKDHDVRWSCVSGRAVYTNAGADTEFIQPLGVCLRGGHTVAVSWIPGETAYTMEVYQPDERRA